ncbi:hypothetical protein ASD06_05945 [Angustibacter sp. Root456]|nr:hypothetical protein ASD06_05945 [Angustibacter sp. Root456]
MYAVRFGTGVPHGAGGVRRGQAGSGRVRQDERVRRDERDRLGGQILPSTIRSVAPSIKSAC